ncbi:hypothetical protein IIB79_08520 [candidate division KSB1 bacterium]|nr:hypothetical protein [candidate division KSB1 bacterium]
MSRAKYGDRVTTVPSRILYEMRGKAIPDAVLEGSTESATAADEEAQPKTKKRKATNPRKKAPHKQSPRPSSERGSSQD